MCLSIFVRPYKTINETQDFSLITLKNISEKKTHLKNFRKETRANLLTEEIVDSCQAGHGAPQSPV